MGREGTRWSKGIIIKDLTNLNRDLKKTILLDVDETMASAQPTNLLKLKPWTASTGGNEDDDGELLRMIPFLEGKKKTKET